MVDLCAGYGLPAQVLLPQGNDPLEGPAVDVRPAKNSVLAAAVVAAFPNIAGRVIPSGRASRTHLGTGDVIVSAHACDLSDTVLSRAAALDAWPSCPAATGRGGVPISLASRILPR
ncbi:MAG: hypothetical protein IPQ07_26415 [Myxococcales bacterium]|nr:hypothetical protein [Myxococcales bacterium]